MLGISHICISFLDDYFRSCYAQILSFNGIDCIFVHLSFTFLAPLRSVSLIFQELPVLLLALVHIYRHLQLIDVLPRSTDFLNLLPNSSILRRFLVIQSILFKRFKLILISFVVFILFICLLLQILHVRQFVLELAVLQVEAARSSSCVLELLP